MSDVPSAVNPSSSPRKLSIGSVVLGCTAVGCIGAVAVVLFVVGGAREGVISGAALVAFGAAWALLAGASIRFTDQPQRWTIVPALAMAATGMVLLVSRPTNGLFEAAGWIWPPVVAALTAWMVWQSRSHLHSRSRVLVLYPVFALLFLAVLGASYEAFARMVDPIKSSATGAMVDVGGHKLYLDCTGSGSPTVVLEPGLGGISSAFGWITPAVEEETRVCSYDRAGRGLSESTPTHPDGLQVASDLHALLTNADVPGPYVLVGHSFGGLYSLVFADQYPEDVAGLVLLDSTSPEQVERGLSGWPGFYDVFRRASALTPSLGRLGATRLVAALSYGYLPPEARAKERASSTPRRARSQRDEFAQAKQSMREAQSFDDFADKPLFVLAAGAGHEAAWYDAQQALAKLSSNSVYRVEAGATHQSLLDDRENAETSSRAILAVVRAVRTGLPLSVGN